MSEFFLFIKHNFLAFLIISIIRDKNMMTVTLNILLYIIPKRFGYPNHEIHYKYRNKVVWNTLIRQRMIIIIIYVMFDFLGTKKENTIYITSICKKIPFTNY